MSKLSLDIYQKIQELDDKVKEDLRKKGIIVPAKKEDGSIQIGRFTIKRNLDGFFSIVDYRKEKVLDNINLPQTAAIIANKLALGKFYDKELLAADQSYGHAVFDEMIHKKLVEKSLKEKDIERADLMLTKLRIAKDRKEHYSLIVKKSFANLLRF